jgi:hypothetical protein
MLKDDNGFHKKMTIIDIFYLFFELFVDTLASNIVIITQYKINIRLNAMRFIQRNCYSLYDKKDLKSQ